MSRTERRSAIETECYDNLRAELLDAKGRGQSTEDTAQERQNRDECIERGQRGQLG
jgi:hypothetical protein